MSLKNALQVAQLLCHGNDDIFRCQWLAIEDAHDVANRVARYVLDIVKNCAANMRGQDNLIELEQRGTVTHTEGRWTIAA